jgi:GT2 family glycosyltransferase
MKIGFVFTNFNNSRFTRTAIHSLSLNKDWNNCYVIIVDNNSDENDIKLLKEIKRDYPSIRLILNSENIGYFKGLNVGINYLRNKEENVNYIILGNNDLCFPNNFIASIYDNLSKLECYAIISPDIIGLNGSHQNPHVVKDISKFREIVYDLYYSNYYLAVIIKKVATLTNKFTDRKDEEQFKIAQTIYQGCGACYILTPLFFNYFELLWAPTFLMGEEYFLSRQLASKNLNIFYEPSIIVHHHCHATMEKIPSKKFWEISRESHKVYRKYIKIWK